MWGEKLTLEQLQNLNVPPIINYAVPIMLGLVLLEFIISHKKNWKVYDGKTFWSSVGVGIGNLFVSALVKSGAFLIVLFCYNLVPWRLAPAWWTYPLCLIVADFCRYWAHWIAHQWKPMWATHVTHHSSENYNFAVSFRLSWTQHIKLIFFLPTVLVGFHPVVFFIIHQMEVLYQFWIHTEFIRKLPKPIEYLFVTPSHHRVHHGRDDKYINWNYGSMLIIWDRIFGTFRPEEERPDYGVVHPPSSYNPVHVVFHVWKDLALDFWNARSWKERGKVLLSRPGEQVSEQDDKSYTPPSV